MVKGRTAPLAAGASPSLNLRPEQASAKAEKKMEINHRAEMVHLGNAPSSDRDRVVPFFERPKGRLGLSDRENYETANTLGFRIGQGTGAIRRLVRRRRDDATAPSRFGKRPRPGCPHRRGSRACVLLVASHDELAPSLSLA